MKQRAQKKRTTNIDRVRGYLEQHGPDVDAHTIAKALKLTANQVWSCRHVINKTRTTSATKQRTVRADPEPTDKSLTIHTDDWVLTIRMK